MLPTILTLSILLDQTTRDVWIHAQYTGPALVWTVRVGDQTKRVAGVTDTWFRFPTTTGPTYQIFQAELLKEE